MGRVRQQQQTPEDKGEPGKFYFNYPITQSFQSQKKVEHHFPEQNTMGGKSPVNLFSYRQQTNCRLLSSKNNSNHKCPEKIAYLLEEHPSAKEIADYHQLRHEDGWGERAIVARRWAPMENLMLPNSWGVIILEHKLERGGAAKWSPYSVRWMILGDIESCWAEDLVLIHPALDNAHLRDILEVQGLKEDSHES